MNARWRISLLLADSVVFILSFALALWLRTISDLLIFKVTVRFVPTEALGFFLAILLIFTLVLNYSFGLYDASLRYSSSKGMVRHGAIFLILFGVVTATFYLTNPYQIPRSVVVLFLLGNFLGHWTVRILLFFFFFSEKLPRILVIGENDFSKRLLREMRRGSSFRCRVVGVLTEKKGAIHNRRHYIFPVLGTWKDILPVLKREEPDVVFIALPDLETKARVIDLIPHHWLQNAFVYVYPSAYEIMIGRPQYIRIHDIPLIRIKRSISRMYGVKRFFDFSFASLLILFTSPLFLIIYSLVRMTSPGPGFFTQWRVGRYETPFRIVKFRTLFDNTATNEQVRPSDRRVTRLGRWLRITRLDELPQLINIVRGEMSFIGPRPLVSHEVEAFKKSTPGFSERFIARPGLTGLAQVHGDYYTQPEDKLRYDLWYCYHFSFYMELTILFRTIKIVILRKGT